MDNVVEFDRVSKRYKVGVTRRSIPTVVHDWTRGLMRRPHPSVALDHWAVSEVSFTLEKGEALALVGPNGAGKSTILKLLSKITAPTSGRITVNGQLSALIELGAGFHPDLTGRENIYLNGTILGLSFKEIQRHFDAIVDFAEVSKFVDTPVKRYSSGMTVRLGFAVASCITPDILLVDEVLAVGDASFRQKCIDRIKELLRGGTSLLFVSHESGLVRSVCNSALYLEEGRVVASGSSDKIIDLYNHTLAKRRSEMLAVWPGELPEDSAGVEVISVDLLDSTGQPAREVHADQLVTLRVRYVAHRNLGLTNALIRVYRSDGLACITVRSHADRFSMHIDRGQGEYSVTLYPLQLYGGVYRATTWIMNADDSDGLASGTSDWFEVNNRVAGKEPAAAVFEPRRKWQNSDQRTDRLLA
jgi:lipopolysaccharide transport system ATP-binding protein